MIIPHDTFLIRPERRYKESLVGYLYRLYSVNGFTFPSKHGSCVYGLYQGDETLQTDDLEVTLGHGNLVNRDWWLTRQGGITWFEGNHLPAWLKRHYKPIRYCPDCLRTSGFHLELWTLPLVEACPEHRRTLLSSCIRCGSQLTWARLSTGWRCGCGMYLPDAAGQPALQWRISLAEVISKAAGLESHPDAETIRQSSTEEAESFRQFYEFMGWANETRHRLGKWHSYERGSDWSISLKPASLYKIGGWEARLLFSDSRMLYRLIRRNFRNDTNALVTIQKTRPLDNVLSLLRRLKGNTFSDAIYIKFEQLLDELNPGIEGWPDLLLHPRFYGQDLRPTLMAFAQWWYALAEDISVLKPELRLSPRIVLGGRRAEAIGILNSLFMAFSLDEDISLYVKLRSRWHLPKDMKQQFSPDEVLTALAQYFWELRYHEQLFVMDLIDDAVHE